jgi:hypothetical protein
MNKRTLALAGLGVGGVLFFALVSSGQAPNIRVVQLTDGTVKYGQAIWSPDGSKILLSTQGRVDIIQADGTNLETVYEGPYAGCKWLDTSEVLVWEKGPVRSPKPWKMQIKQIDRKKEVKVLLGNEPDLLAQETEPVLSAPLTLPDGSVGVYVERNNQKVFKIIRPGKLPPEEAVKQTRVKVKESPGGGPWGEILIESYDGTFRKSITPGRKYLFPVFSPDRSKILAEGDGGTVVLDTSGVILHRLHFMEDKRWSPDSKRIAYDIATYSESDISGSEIHIMNIDGSEDIQVTNSPDEIEIDPMWAPDSKKLLFSDYRTGKIYVAFLVW